MPRDLLIRLRKSTLAMKLAMLRDDIRGVAAIEFAFVFPLLLVFYMGSVEIGRGINVNKKVGRVAATIGDLVAQEDDVTRDQIREILEVGQLIMEPYASNSLKIEVVAIQMSNEPSPVARVAWSQKLDNGGFGTPYPKDALIADVPNELKTPDAFVIRVTTEYTYTPAMVWVLRSRGGLINMGERYYNRPRVNPKIECVTGCV